LDSFSDAVGMPLPQFATAPQMSKTKDGEKES
jgi:hypothetical protein